MSAHFLLITVREIISRPHVLWVDNFSKCLATSVPDSMLGAYKACLWTGFAVFACTDESISDTVVHNLDGSVRPAMPDDILDGSQEVARALHHVIGQGWQLYSTSLVATYDVRNIPPKIDTHVFPELAQTIEDPKNTLFNVYPNGLVDMNIGSNRGLAAVIRQLYEQYGMQPGGDCSRYLTVNVDENIYWRTLKVRFFR